MSARRFTFSLASLDESLHPGLNLASAVGIIDCVRLPNSIWAGLVFRPSVGVLWRLSRAICGSSPELLLFIRIIFAIFTSASEAPFA